MRLSAMLMSQPSSRIARGPGGRRVSGDIDPESPPTHGPLTCSHARSATGQGGAVADGSFGAKEHPSEFAREHHALDRNRKAESTRTCHSPNVSLPRAPH